MARGIQTGDKAPDFTLPSQAGEPVVVSPRAVDEPGDVAGDVRVGDGGPQRRDRSGQDRGHAGGAGMADGVAGAFSASSPR